MVGSHRASRGGPSTSVTDTNTVTIKSQSYTTPGDSAPLSIASALGGCGCGPGSACACPSDAGALRAGRGSPAAVQGVRACPPARPRGLAMFFRQLDQHPGRQGRYAPTHTRNPHPGNRRHRKWGGAATWAASNRRSGLRARPGQGARRVSNCPSTIGSLRGQSGVGSSSGTEPSSTHQVGMRRQAG